MPYQFFQSDCKFGIARDKKSFCVVTKDDVVIYDDIDSYVNALRDFLVFLTSNNDKKDE